MVLFMKLPEITETTKRAIDVLSKYDENSLDAINLFMGYAKKAGDVSDDPDMSEPLYVDFEDYDYLHDTNTLQPIYLNDFDFNLKEEREALAALTRMEFSGNTFDNIAKCSESCGKLRGNYLINSGRVCTECGNEVSRFFSRGEDTILWIKKPEGVKAFVNIGVYSALFDNINIGSPGVKLVEFFLDSSYRRKITKTTRFAKTVLIIREMMSVLGIREASLNSFYDHADAIFEWLLVGEGRTHFKKNAQYARECWEVWNKYKHLAFCNYIKVPNREMNILERNGREVYGYEYQSETARIYYALGDCLKSNSLYKLGDKELKKNLDIVGRNLVALTHQYKKKNNGLALYGKKGLNRKHVCSGSIPFTGRSVITSITGVFNTDELLVPWRICLVSLELHITSYLYRLGYTPYQVNEKILNAAYKIDPEIDAFFTWMEENEKCLIQSGRNPSIEYLSLKTFKLRVNRCLEDESIKISILAIDEQNAKILAH